MVQKVGCRHGTRVHTRLGSDHIRERRQVVPLRRVEQRMGETVGHERLGIQVHPGLAAQHHDVGHLGLGKRLVQAEFVELWAIIVSQRDILFADGRRILRMRAVLDIGQQLVCERLGIHASGRIRALHPALGRRELAVIRTAAQIGERLIGRDQPVVVNMNGGDLPDRRRRRSRLPGGPDFGRRHRCGRLPGNPSFDSRSDSRSPPSAARCGPETRHLKLIAHDSPQNSAPHLK